uniref:TonB family protein n=1 Tax=Candidatus Scatousia sp. TaxID=3085663 RepID=UPI00402758B6
MSILDKYTNNLLEDEESEETSGYTTPAVLREDKEGLTLKKSFWISVLLHPSAVGAVWLITLILMLLGFNMHLFDKPKPKVNNIEFVLVDKEDTPINKKTPYRADRNSRAGGHHDPTKKVSMPSTPSAPAAKPSTPAPAAKAKPAPAPKQTPKPQQVKKPEPAKKALQNLMPKPAQKPVPKPQEAPAAPKAVAPAKPNPPTARPSIKPPNTPKPVAKPSSAFQVPVPKGGTAGGHYATGPISGSGKLANGGSSGGSGSSSSGRYTPAPVLAPTGAGSSSGSKLAKGAGSGGGSGAYGNPGPGNPNGRPGIDAIREPDFGPYMRELQRRIKMNWNPPKGNESKRVVLLFKIAKDGRLLSCSVFKSSGLPSADSAAINAVKLTAPFKPLPAEFKGQSIDIQFTFDYNVFGASGY